MFISIVLPHFPGRNAIERTQAVSCAAAIGRHAKQSDEYEVTAAVPYERVERSAFAAAP
ncbi:hypothetical protein ACHFCA_04615 [Delftia tsuruhatensis]